MANPAPRGLACAVVLMFASGTAARRTESGQQSMEKGQFVAGMASSAMGGGMGGMLSSLAAGAGGMNSGPLPKCCQVRAARQGSSQRPTAP